MAIVDIDETTKQPTEIHLHTDAAIVVLNADGNRWYAQHYPHSQGRPLMEALRFKPSIERPFGKSRINRAVMSITDNATREIMRAEISAELFTAPQRYILGAKDSAFDIEKWKQYLTSLLLISKDEDGDIPKFGQLSPASMEPHNAYMRKLAAEFSGETGVPVSSLGYIMDSNPSSAEAIHAAREDLIIDAEDLNLVNTPPLRNLALLSMAISQGKRVADLSDAEKTVMPKFRNPAKPSKASQADAMLKLIQAFPGLADSDVALEESGFTDDQIMRIKADRRRAEGIDLIRSLANGQAGGVNVAS